MIIYTDYWHWLSAIIEQRNPEYSKPNGFWQKQLKYISRVVWETATNEYLQQYDTTVVYAKGTATIIFTCDMTIGSSAFLSNAYYVGAVEYSQLCCVMAKRITHQCIKSTDCLMQSPTSSSAICMMIARFAILLKLNQCRLTFYSSA